MTCVFCRILAGELPASFVRRDDGLVAFMDIQPVNPGHLLVVPVEHVELLGDLDPETGRRMFAVAQELTAAVRRALGADGVNLFLADGEAAFQQVPHVHLHVIPRFAGDGFALRFPPDYEDRPPRAELDRLAGILGRAAGVGP